MAQLIPVRFAGEGAGVEKLTWAQWSSWASMVGGGVAIEWTGGTMPLAEGTTVDEVAATLGFLMSRHQSLRTRFREDVDGKPEQVVFDSGEIMLEVVDAADDEDPAVVTEAVRARLEATEWDGLTDWPVRMSVIRHHGAAAYFVALYSHLVIDGYGFDALVADLPNLDHATGRHLAPVGGMQPLEQARMQRSPASLKQHQMAMKKWERWLRTIAPRRFPESRDKREPRYWEATYSSPATFLALPAIAERTKVHTGSILLSAHAIAVARISGDSTSVIRTLVSNRFRPGFAESVSAVMQSGLCIVDVADCTFDEVVAKTFKSQLAAGMAAYYYPPDLWDMIDRISAERGIEIDLMSYFNDRRRSVAAQLPTGPIASREEVLAALPDSTLTWGPRTDGPDATCYLHINSVPDTIEYTLLVDTHSISPSDMEGCLHGIEAIIVEAAFDSHMSSGVRSAPVSVPM